MTSRLGRLTCVLILGGFFAACDAGSAFPSESGVPDAAPLEAAPPDAGPSCGFTARFGLSAVAVGGTIFAVGGTQVGPIARAETFGPAGRWIPAAPLPAPVTWGGAAAVAGGFVVVGGDGDGSRDGSLATDRFDVASGAWSAGPALAQPLWANAAASGADGTVYALGGLVGTSTSPISDLEQLPPGAPAWKAAAPMPTARSFLGAAVGRDGRLYAIGGCAVGCSAVLSKAEVYDPVAGAWSSVTPMPTARAHLAVTAGPDGRIYALGGIDSVGNPLDAAEAYDPATGAWATLPPLPAARSDLAAAFGSDGRLRALGGQNAAFEPVGEVDAFDPAAGAWTTTGCEAGLAGWPAPATFAELKTQLFQGLGCTQSGCHEAGAGPAVGNLDLVTDPYTALLGPDGKGAPATNAQGRITGLLRVAPGDPSHSLLWLKLSLHAVDYSTYGQPMPGSMPNTTPPALLGGLAAWIQAGAHGP